MVRTRSYRRIMRERKIKHRVYLSSFSGHLVNCNGMYAKLTTNCGCKMCQNKSGRYRSKSSNIEQLKTKRDRSRINAMKEAVEEAA